MKTRGRVGSLCRFGTPRAIRAAQRAAEADDHAMMETTLADLDEEIAEIFASRQAGAGAAAEWQDDETAQLNDEEEEEMHKEPKKRRRRKKKKRTGKKRKQPRSKEIRNDRLGRK